MFYEGLLNGARDGDSGNRDEIVATGMANARKSVHLCKSGIRAL